MPDRTVEEIRRDIASERQRLADDLDALHGEARSFVPVAVGGLLALALLSRGKHLKSGVKLLWRLL